MKARIVHLAAALLTAAALFPAPAKAQAPVPQDTSLTLRIFQYENEKKSPGLAVALNLIPPLGYAYAGNVKRGLIPAAFVWGGAIAAVAIQGDCVVYDYYWGFCQEWENEDSPAYLAASFAIVGGFVWGLVDSYSTVQARNRRLRERLKLAVLPASGGGMQFRAEVPFR
jgi:hypothetical protein